MNILWVEVIAKWAIIKVHFIEDLIPALEYSCFIEPCILVFRNDPVTNI